MEIVCFKSVKNAKINFCVILELDKQQLCMTIKHQGNVRNVEAHSMIQLLTSDKIYLSMS